MNEVSSCRHVNSDLFHLNLLVAEVSQLLFMDDDVLYATTCYSNLSILQINANHILSHTNKNAKTIAFTLP